MTEDAPSRGAALASSAVPLTSAYDVALCDLDGVVYLGADPIPHAVQALAAAREAGLRPAYVTNNASRSAQAVADLLSGLGLPTVPDDVVTSAQAAGDLLAAALSPGARVLVIGTAALADEIAQRGLVPVREAGSGPRTAAAVVQGHSTETDWSILAEAAVALRAGARWVATNDDSTLPSARGPLPGNGAMVAALRTASGRAPEIAGKPEAPLFRTALARSGGNRTIFVGDRLDTDIAGGAAAGLDTMLVLSGVADLSAVVQAPPGWRPAFVAPDLRGLLESHPAVEVEGETARCGGASARVVAGRLKLAGAETPSLRAACALAWEIADRGVTVTL